MKKRELEIGLKRDFVVGENKETNLTYTLLSEILNLISRYFRNDFSVIKAKVMVFYINIISRVVPRILMRFFVPVGKQAE